MSEHNHTPAHEGSFASYTFGFVLSVVLTIVPYYLVTHSLQRGWALAITLLLFAIAQLTVQLFMFLHMGNESRPRWHMQSFIFAVIVVLILVVGSIWIMQNLNYRMTPMSHNTDKYIINDEGFSQQ
jgi:cytochrome o ubiquinol oxidase operon protein cyoD